MNSSLLCGHGVVLTLVFGVQWFLKIIAFQDVFTGGMEVEISKKIFH